MRFDFPPLTPTVRTLLAVLIGTLLVQVLLDGESGVALFPLLSLQGNPPSLVMWSWQVFTHVLVEPVRMGSFVLMPAIGFLFLYLLLARFEMRYGAAHTWGLTLTATLGASLPVLPFYLALPSLFTFPVAGAAPISLAAVAAYAATVPGGVVYFAGVYPMKAWHVITLILVLAGGFAMSAGDFAGFVSNAGGIGAGVLYTRWMQRPARPKKASAKRKRRRSGPALRVVEGGRGDDEPPRYLN